MSKFKRGNIVISIEGEFKGLVFMYESDYPVGVDNIGSTQALVRCIYGPNKDKKILVYKSEIALISEVLDNHSSPKYKIGECGSIYKESSFSFFIGIICDIKQQGVINIYEVRILNGPNFDSLSDDTAFIAENNIIGIINNDNNENIISNSSIIKYLDEKQRKEIEAKIYEEKVATYIDDVLKNRSSANKCSITDLVLQKASEKYVEKLAPNFEEDFLKVVKEEISRTEGLSEDHYIFREGLSYTLQRAAEKYIDSHQDEINEIMKDYIYEVAENLMNEKFNDLLSFKLKKCCDSVLSELLHSEENKDN